LARLGRQERRAEVLRAALSGWIDGDKACKHLLVGPRRRRPSPLWACGEVRAHLAPAEMLATTPSAQSSPPPVGVIRGRILATGEATDNVNQEPRPRQSCSKWPI
jgi:hypothetical protein